MFLRFLADVGTVLVAPGTPIGSRNRGFSLSFFSFLGYGCPKHTMFLYIFATKPRFFIEFFHSSCVLLFPGLFLSRRVISEASDGSLWASFVGPGLPCGLPVGRFGTTVLRFQHFLLFIILLIFMNS